MLMKKRVVNILYYTIHQCYYADIILRLGHNWLRNVYEKLLIKLASRRLQ